MWDLFALDPHNGGVSKRSNRGECLSRLNAKTLIRLRDWLAAKEEEAVQQRLQPARFEGLWTEVSLLACLGSLLAAETLFCEERDPTLPLEAVAYARRGRAW